MQNYFSVKLPSGGKLYEGIDPSSIQVCAFTGGDESVLSEMTEKNAVEKLSQVLGRCLKGVDIKELTLGDKLFLLVWHAINSYTDGYETKIVCQHCLQEVRIEYKLADVKIKYLPELFVEPHPITLSDGHVVNCRLFRVKDEIQINTYEKELENSYLYKIATYIIDPTKNIVERVAMLNDMPAKDIAQIRAFQDYFYHGPDFEMVYTCPKCDGRGIFIVPFRFEHFYPFGNSLTKTFRTKV